MVSEGVFHFMDEDEIKNSGFSLIYTLSILFSNFIIDPIFGTIGGIIGVQIVNSKASKG